MSLGTLFTLFVVPSLYVLFARDHRKAHAKEIEVQRAAAAAAAPTDEPPPPPSQQS
jgi:hypothetical protein